MSIKIFPYRVGSRSVRALADALGCRILRREGSRYRSRLGDLIINWGASDHPDCHHVLNARSFVREASNKLLAFSRMEQSNISIPDFWTNIEDIPDEAFPIVCRSVLNGHSGVGITVANDRGGLVRCPLYVRYIKKRAEYRVHVFQGVVIAVQQKLVRRGFENPDYRIRNHANGFVFARDGINCPDDVLEQSVKAIEALHLDFGAVDVIWNEHFTKAYVLEVNTAPGLEGQTVQDYATAIQRYYDDRR